MLRRIAGEGGINSMRVNLVHKGKKAALKNRFLSAFSHTASKHRSSVCQWIHPSTLWAGNEHALYIPQKMLISQKNHCVVVTLSTGNTGIQSLKTVHELYSWTKKCSEQFKILCFQHSYKKTPPPLQSSSPKNLSENHIQDLQLYIEADLRNEGFALFCRQAFYLAAITQSANSTTGVINVQTPYLCRQAVNRCDMGEEHTKRALKISASFQQSAAVRGWRSGFENEKGGKEDNHKGGWVNTEGRCGTCGEGLRGWGS